MPPPTLNSEEPEKPTRPNRSRPRLQAPGPPTPAPGGTGPPHLVVPGPSPTSIRTWRTQPRRVSELIPGPFAGQAFAALHEGFESVGVELGGTRTA